MLKKFLLQSSIYASGDIVTRGMSFILLPLYTAFLTPEDYGILGICNVIIMIFPIIATFGLRGGALKFYYDFDAENERKQFYGTIWLFCLVTSGVSLLTLELFGENIFRYFVVQIPYHPFIRLAIWTGFIIAAFIMISRELFRASARAKAYTIVNLGIFVFSTGLTLWLVVGLKKGAEGALLSRMVGTGVVAFIVGIYLGHYVRFSFNLFMLKKALMYCIPMIPHFLAYWVLNASNRIILVRFVPLAEVGIFSLGFTIASALYLISIAQTNAIIPLYGELKINNSQSVQKAIKATTYYVASIWLIGLIIALFSKELVHLATPDVYHRAVSVIPWLVLGFLFLGMYFPLAAVMTLVCGNSIIIGISTTIAASLNIMLNILLIPHMGIQGAAMTHTLTYFLLFVGLFYFVKKYQPLPFEYRRIFLILFSTSIIFLVGLILSPSNILISLLVKMCSLFILPIVLLKAGFFTEQERMRLKQYIPLLAKLWMHK